MGAETSHEAIDEDVAPLMLSARTVKAIAEYIKSEECKKVVFMVCSRMSCSRFSIPDTLIQRLALGYRRALGEFSVQSVGIFPQQT